MATESQHTQHGKDMNQETADEKQAGKFRRFNESLTKGQKWLLVGGCILVAGLLSVVILAYMALAGVEMHNNVRAYLLLALEALRIVIWPLIILAVVACLRPVILGLVPRLSKLRLSFPTVGEIDITVAELKGVTESLLQDVEDLIADLGDDAKSLLKEIKSQSDRGEVFTIRRDFKRSTKEDATEEDALLHKLLRELRDCKLIAPVGGGHWRKGQGVANGIERNRCHGNEHALPQIAAVLLARASCRVAR